MKTGGEDAPATVPFRRVIGHRQFRWIWSAELASTLGDQAARVALSVLVFHRTGSAALTGLAYALTFLPNLVGAFALGGIADRWPYRRVMVAVDLFRAVCAAVMAIPGMPLPVVLIAVSLLGLVHPVFKGAQGASIRRLLDDKRQLGTANSWRQLLLNTGALTGFALGGVISAWSTSLAMAVNAASFVLSAVLLIGLSGALAPESHAKQRSASHTDRRSTARRVWHHTELRALLIMITMVAVYIGPEAMAAPYVASVGGGPVATGLMFAATPAGSMVGAVLSARLLSAQRDHQWLVPASIVAGLPLLLFVLHPPLWAAIAAVAVTGCFVMIALNILFTTLMHTAPEDVRGWVSGVQSTTLQVSQGVGSGLLGIFAAAASTGAAIALGGALGVILCAVTGFAWLRARRELARSTAGAQLSQARS